MANVQGQGMQNQGRQRDTGASDLEYDLVAEMHEILEGNAALEKYIQDAKQAGDSEVERCFEQIHEQNKQNVSALRDLLAQRLTGNGQKQQQVQRS
ncbi:MAG TPA: hypothetical protein VLS89_12030 [Candidatus Nanopelagicales bacterium]|nr:hypothetical protein [Candidatus Nanopelagicales bacterium]